MYVHRTGRNLVVLCSPIVHQRLSTASNLPLAVSLSFLGDPDPTSLSFTLFSSSVGSSGDSEKVGMPSSPGIWRKARLLGGEEGEERMLAEGKGARRVRFLVVVGEGTSAAGESGGKTVE